MGELFSPDGWLPPATEDNDTDVQSNRLIDKLWLSGELRASFLVRVLKQGEVELFDFGLAKILGVSLAGFRDRFYRDGPGTAALACRAAGMDRCVFQTIYSLSRRAHGMVHCLRSTDIADVEAAFLKPKIEARALLQAA
jgi:Uncharacterised protein conserved in bacteria (DUF2336)